MTASPRFRGSGGGGSPGPNYITPEGAKRLQDELLRLRITDRPKIVREVADAAAQGDRSENAEYIYGKKKLREIDRRTRFLLKRLEAAMVVAPRTDEPGRVFFGATVHLQDEDGATYTYRLVGEDEIDLEQGHISWKSPLGRGLLARREGDSFTFRRPSGELEMTVLRVQYTRSDVPGDVTTSATKPPDPRDAFDEFRARADDEAAQRAAEALEDLDLDDDEDE